MVLYDSKLDTRVLTSKCHGTVDNIVADEGQVLMKYKPQACDAMTSKYTQIGPIVEGKHMETMCNCVDNMTFAATQRTIKTKAVVTREVRRFVKFAIRRIKKEFKPRGFDGLGRIDLCNKAIELIK